MTHFFFNCKLLNQKTIVNSFMGYEVPRIKKIKNIFVLNKKKIDFKKFFFNKVTPFSFNLNFKITHSNIILTVTKNNKVIFWNTINRLHQQKVKAYTLKSILNLCENCVYFLKNKFSVSKIKILNFKFIGLIKFRLFIVKFFLKNKFFIGLIQDLNFPAHNGVRACKKKRLPKKKRRKIYWFSEVKFLKKKKKFDVCTIFFKSYDTFYIKNFLLKFYKFQFFTFAAIFFKVKRLQKISILRSVHNFNKSKYHYVNSLHNLKFRVYLVKSNFVSCSFIIWLKNLKIMQYSGKLKIIFKKISCKF